MDLKFDVKDKLKVGIGVVKNVKVTKSSDELLKYMEQTEKETREKWSIEDLTSKEEFTSYRSLWWAYNMDPTKLRPSPEALIRRVLEGKQLYHVNNVVDAMNAVSIKYALSLGLHDVDKLKPPIEIRKARAGETFLAIGTKGGKKIKGTELVVADQEKIIDLGISTSTSDISKVTDKTKDVLVIVYAPEYFSEDVVQKCLEECCEQVAGFSNGAVDETRLEINKGLKMAKPKECPQMVKESKKEEPELIGITVKKDENFPDWYTEAVLKSDLADYAAIAGCIIFKPYSYEIWEFIQDFMNKDMKARDHKNAYFPLFIPEGFLQKEAKHFEGFTPEVAWIERSDESEEKFAVRPTSETIIMDSYAKWVRSYRDLPILINQWCNIVRWETMVTKPFLRTREFLWQEGHTAHKTYEEAAKEVDDSHEMYEKVCKELLAIPGLIGKKSKAETFPGAEYTLTYEAMMPDGKALQMCTSHHLGQNFAKGFGIKFLDEDGETKHVHTTSWGMSTRTIGAVVMMHGDDKGLVLPPRLAPIQVVVIPIVFDKTKKQVLDKANKLTERLSKFRVELDDRDNYNPGWKYNHWELKGVPIRIEIGPKDLEKKQAVLVRRDTGEKIFIKETELEKKIGELLEKIQANLYKKAEKFLKDNIREVKNFDEFNKTLNDKKGFITANWCGELQCELEIKGKTTATVRAIPLTSTKGKGKCIHCGKAAKHVAYFGKAY